MSPEAQRIAIAEACGIVSKDKWGSLYKTPRGILRDCPDYLNDLNAMHQAEKILDYNQLRDMEDSVSFRFAVLPFHATAAQRAEAFLLTIGKWEGAK
jgi:hypothetical protein